MAFRFHSPIFRIGLRLRFRLWLNTELLHIFRLRLSTYGPSRHLHGAHGFNKNFSEITGDTVVVFPATNVELSFDVDLPPPCAGIQSPLPRDCQTALCSHSACSFIFPFYLSRQVSDVTTDRFVSAPHWGCNELPGPDGYRPPLLLLAVAACACVSLIIIGFGCPNRG